MTRKIIPSPDFPFSLSLVRQWLGDPDASDDLILEILEAVTDEAETHLETISIMGATYEQTMDEFPETDEVIFLDKSPLQKVNSIKYIDENDAEQTWAATNYRTDTNGLRARIQDTDGWPDDVDDRINAVTVNYDAGHTYKVESVNTTTDALTITGHPFSDGDVVRLYVVNGALPKPLEVRKNYYVVSSATNTIDLALTSGGASVDITEDLTDFYVMKPFIPSEILSAMKHRIRQYYDDPNDVPEPASRFHELLDMVKITVPA